ncbi:MAG TPA: FhaA domain-containing protein [Acidimicrobiia bacterium]|nr:FhaA domain-containing protein [Acidimicrobiia bacterium]
MKLARVVERRLERMLDGMAGRVFQGRVHPTEIAQRMVREADLESLEHPTGPMAANSLTVVLNPEDLDLPPASLSRLLAEAYEAHAAEEGWRLPGPTYVSIRLNPDQSPGSVGVSLEVRKGQRHPWGRLTGTPPLDLNNNRMWVGRGEDCDVVVPFEEISRRHAEIVRRHGSVWVRDLGSANGTRIDGGRVGEDPVELRPGSVVVFADRSYRLEIA